MSTTQPERIQSSLDMMDNASSFPVAASVALGFLGHSFSSKWISGYIGRRPGSPSGVDHQWRFELLVHRFGARVERVDPYGLIHGVYEHGYDSYVDHMAQAGRPPVDRPTFGLRAEARRFVIPIFEGFERRGLRRYDIQPVGRNMRSALAARHAVIAGRLGVDDMLHAVVLRHQVGNNITAYDPSRGTVTEGTKFDAVIRDMIAPDAGYLAISNVRGFQPISEQDF